MCNTLIKGEETSEVVDKVATSETEDNLQPKYKKIMINYPGTSEDNEINYNVIDNLLEKEKLHNKTETWNKLDKTVKIQKLHAFSEKYGKDNALPMKDIKALKSFFVECLEKNKLQKTKDVIYDKETREINSIPSLFFNSTNRIFSLRSNDNKRVSTLKSLTPKRGTPNSTTS